MFSQCPFCLLLICENFMNATATPRLTQAQLTQAARQALTLMDLTSLNDSDTDSVIEALCDEGCSVEPDGRCSHGCPSPLLAMGLI